MNDNDDITREISRRLVKGNRERDAYHNTMKSKFVKADINAITCTLTRMTDKILSRRIAQLMKIYLENTF